LTGCTYVPVHLLGEPAIAHLLRPLLQAAGVVSEIWIHGIAFAVAFTSITAAHLVFGEQAPKIYARRRPETMLLLFALPLKFFYLVSYPFMIALNATTSLLLKKIGLRFTTLINLHGQRILIPNRNIAVISQFRGGCIRAYVDIQLPSEINEAEVSQSIQAIAKGMYQQHRSIILAAPETFGVKEAKAGQWRYLRIKFKLWPGQMKIIEETFEESVVQVLKRSFPDYAAWMITVTYKVE
jgi:hypothetical protein